MMHLCAWTHWAKWAVTSMGPWAVYCSDSLPSAPEPLHLIFFPSARSSFSILCAQVYCVHGVLPSIKPLGLHASTPAIPCSSSAPDCVSGSEANERCHRGLDSALGWCARPFQCYFGPQTTPGKGFSAVHLPSQPRHLCPLDRPWIYGYCASKGRPVAQVGRRPGRGARKAFSIPAGMVCLCPAWPPGRLPGPSCASSECWALPGLLDWMPYCSPCRPSLPGLRDPAWEG